jgi:transcriptional antiterminator NusG
MIPADLSCQTAWYALQVRTLHEQSVAAAMRGKGYEEFVPTYERRHRWSDRIRREARPLFPGYVFCRFDPRCRLPILTTPGVRAIVGAGREPVAVDEAEIEAVRRLVRSGLGVEPWPYFNAGDRVEIRDGPLCGVEGVLLEVKRRRRLVVSVTLLHRSVAVEIDGSAVMPARMARLLGGEIRNETVHSHLIRGNPLW